MLRAHPDAPWLAATAGVLLVLCGLPYVVSAWFGPSDLQRTGTFWFVRDFSQYQAAMREGASQSGWLIHDRFSAEAHQAAFIYPFYVGAGKLAAALHVDSLAVFSALEWLGRLSLLGALYAFASTFLQTLQTRRLAVLLAAGSLGLMGLLAPLRPLMEALGAHEVAMALPMSINVYLELNSFGVFLSAPHLMFGLALTLLSGVLYLQRKSVGLGLATLGLSLIHPFNLPVLSSVLIGHALWNGRMWWAPAAIATLASAPVSLYNALLFSRDPFWSGTYSAQNTMPAPAPWALPIDLGLLLLAAPLAWTTVRSWPADRRRLIVLWIALGLLWLYVPLPYQRRFAFGVQPALAVLAAIGLLRLGAQLHSRLVNYALAIALLTTPVLVYVAVVASAAHNAPTEVYLWSRAEAAAAEWIGEHSTRDDVVLASTEYANPMIGAIDGRVVHGHIVATFDSPTKQALLRRFFAGDTPAQERSAIIRQTGATLVAFGPHERALGASALDAQPDLELVYDQDGVEVFQVRL
ncbi:MAG TPA: hypothetical protein VGL99_33660 [Chloroflexota bacterium]